MEKFEHLNDYIIEAYETTKSKGFHDSPVDLSICVANLHSELSELWECYRKNTWDEHCSKSPDMIMPLTNAEEELADICLRLLDTCGEFKIDLSKAVMVKNQYNKQRPHRNGGRKC